MSEDSLVYNSSDWKTLTFTYVEYPKGKLERLSSQTHHHQEFVLN